MSRSTIRLMFAGLLSACCAWLISGSGKSVNAQIAVQGGIAVGGQPGKKKDDKKKDERPEEDRSIPFAFPYERYPKELLKAARDYLDWKVIPWNKVCPPLQDILESKADSFYDTYYSIAGTKKLLRISVKSEANRIISQFPGEGLQFYQQTYGATASSQLNDAIKANYDLPAIADISQRYFHTKAGGEATAVLGSIYLERGNYLEAAYAFERLFGRAGAEEFFTPLTLYKACLAFKRSGDPRHSELLKTSLDHLRKATAKDGLTLGRKAYSFDQLKAEIERPLELLRVTTTVDQWAMRGGNAERSGTIAGGAPFLDPTFRNTMFYNGDDEANSWIKAELDRQFSRENKKALPLPAFFPITTPDLVIYRAYNGIIAVGSRDQMVNGHPRRAGEVLWVSKASFGAHQMLTTGDPIGVEVPKKLKEEWWPNYTQGQGTSVLYENPLLGMLSHDGQFAYFVDDVAIPPPPVYSNPDFGIPAGPQFPQNGELADAIRAGRLVAVDMRSGLMKWDLGRVHVEDGGTPIPNPLTEEEADKTTSAFDLCLDAIFLGAPMPMNGRLYVLVEQAGVIRLLCLDPRTLVAVPGQTKKPTLVWSQKLGKPNNPLPGDSPRRYQGCTLAAGEGIIICPTNSGAIVAVDTMSRSLLWAHAYKYLDPNTRPVQPTFGPNGQPVAPQQLKADRWRAGGPIISNGRIILTAYDSDVLQCLELRSGKVLWSLPRDTTNDLYVGGVVNDRVIVVAKNQVKGYHLTGEVDQKPKVAFEPLSLGGHTPTGHGVGGKGVYYVPLRSDNAGRDNVPPAEIWAVNVETGQAVKTLSRKRGDNTELARYGLGNLVFQDGMVFAQSAWELACFPQLEVKKAEMNRLLAMNPNDPVGLLARGELLLDDGQLKEAIADFKGAQKNNLPPEKRPLLREKLYFAYTELLRNDFPAAEAILPEYEGLCELPIDPEVDPVEKQNRLDETDRRKRLALYLVARGREGQGRLGEAFDKYRDLAKLGEGKSLLDMPDEPNVRMRPDVWARGRIEAMIRGATDPKARKSLEERVNKEWEAVKDGTDLKRLQEFVSVFGPYFTSGAEAQFVLADKLLQTKNEADAREAQTHLAQLRATAEDATVRARATEALARLMVNNRLMEDAVGLYLQLGKEYPDVVIRDGKTGADFMRSLLTDKRLLPYLEPSKYPMPSRMKAEQKGGNNTFNNNGQFEIEPGGDLFPMYKRYRFVIEQYSDNGTWSIRAEDRATDAVKAKFTRLNQPGIYNPGSFPFSKYVQGNGQLLLVQLGTWVYCLDLAEKKERWRKDLLGDIGGITVATPQIQNPGPDGEVTVKYAEGYYLTFGRAAVLQAGYAALLTRDGIEVVEPTTQRTLWTRKGMPERTQIYGDARYLVVVETDSNRKPISVKLLRAVDGMQVEGSPDSGRVLATAKSFQLLGRTALISEGTGDKPRVLRLYDLGTGKDVWRKEYDAKAIPIRSPIASDWGGFIRPDGVAEIIDVKTGKVATTLRIDEKNLETDLKPCVSAQLFADQDRFYLFLDREEGVSTTKTRRSMIHNSMLRTTPVNGPLYAFDRVTGKRLWSFGEGLFENQVLVLEQFAELPVIIAAGPVQLDSGQQTYPVVVLEKARGRIIFERNVVFNHNFFHNLFVNPKNGTIDLNRPDNVRIAVFPDDNRPTP